MSKEQEYEDYLDEKFPKGKDKRRGEALVVGALGIIKGRQEREAEIIEIIDRFLQEDGIELIKQIKSKEVLGE